MQSPQNDWHFLGRLRYTAGMISWCVFLWSCVKPVVPVAGVVPSTNSLPALRGRVAELPSPDENVHRIAFGSCANQNAPMPILNVLRERDPDLFVMLGDNVYGDAKSGDPSLPELRSAYAALAQHSDFRPLAAEVPVLPMWDDHDYGENDGGGDFAFKYEAERIFESFWGVEAPDPRLQREGVYGAWTFGPEQQRVQLVLLDTRFFRSALTPIPERTKLKGRYIESVADDQAMLGSAQWVWLEQTLKQPAELRIVVSSIQVLAEGHGWERWGLLPTERARLLTLLHATPNVVVVSGDRHWSSIYRDETGLTEMTSSSINRPSQRMFTETGPHQFTTPYVRPNFGEIDIDWETNRATLTTFDVEGVSVARVDVVFASDR